MEGIHQPFLDRDQNASYNQIEVIPLKRLRFVIALGVVSTFVLLFPLTASANSSWHWISSKKPYNLLIFVIPMTLIAESLAINYIPAIRKPLKVFCVVGAANIASYLAPYLFLYLELAGNPYEIRSIAEMYEVLDHMPHFTVGIVFLLITLCAELPIVYFTLRRDCEKKKLLLITIITVNAFTTALCALAERLICSGSW